MRNDVFDGSTHPVITSPNAGYTPSTTPIMARIIDLMSNTFDLATARLIFDTMDLSDAFELSYQLRDHPPEGDGRWVHQQLLEWLEDEVRLFDAEGWD